MAASAPAGANTPRLVLLRDGGPALHRPLPTAGRPDSVPGPAAIGGGSARSLRSFPHDLRAPGAPRFRPRPVADLVRRGLTEAAASAPAETLRLAIMRVDFEADSHGDRFTGDGRFDLRTGTGIPVDPPPHDRAYLEAHGEALARFYRAQSYGSLVIVPTVFPADPRGAYHLADTGDYGPWEVSQSAEVVLNAETFVTDCIRAVEASGEVDFSAFDAFVVVHAGADYQGDVNRDSPDDIPTFTLSLGDSIVTTTGKVGKVLVLPETASQDDRLAALNGVFAHEFGHILDLPDLYNICDGTPQVGYWSLMDSGENVPVTIDPDTTVDGDEYTVEGVFPVSFDPWCKLQLFPRVMAPNLVAVGHHWQDVLEATEANPALPWVEMNAREFYLVENRALDLDGNGFPYVQQDSTTGVFLGPADDPGLEGQGGELEYDAVLPGGGVLIWHIDDAWVQPALNGQDTGLGCPGSVNVWTLHRGIALVEADRIYDLGWWNARMFGSPYDPFYLGNNTRFGPDTEPPTTTNAGIRTGIDIQVTSAPERFMGVSVDRPQGRDGWPVRLRSDSVVRLDAGTSAPLDLNGDGLPEVAFGADALELETNRHTRGVAAVRADGSPITSSFLAVTSARLLPGLASSPSFRIGGGDTAPVLAATENGGRVHLWAAGGDSLHELFDPVGPVPATTPPILVQGPPEAGADWVLYGGPAGLYGRDATGAAVFTGAVPGAAPGGPTAGPVSVDVAPSQLILSADGPVLPPAPAALALAGGLLAGFDLGSPTGGPVFTRRFGGDVTGLALGGVLAGGGPSVIAFTADSAAVLDPRGTLQAAWPLEHPLVLPPALGDLDGDGLVEIVGADVGGAVRAWNGDGSPALGWPRPFEAPVRDLKLCDLDGDGRLDVLVLDGPGNFHALDGGGQELAGWPLAYGPYDAVSAWVAPLDADGELTWMATLAGGYLLADRLPGSAAMDGDWRFPGRSPEGRAYAPANAGGVRLDRPDLGPDRLRVYPNPARDGVEVHFLLAEGERAELTVLDLSGRELTGARLDRREGFQPGENSVRWDLSGVAPGLYFCRLERQGSGAGRVDLAKVMVLR